MTDKPQLYVVGDSGPVIETNDALDAIVLDADAQAERMSFGAYNMSKDGLLFGDDYIVGPFEILGRARDPNGDDWARWICFKDSDGRHHQVAIRDADLHGDPRTLAATLARQGLWISPKHRQQLVGYFNDLQTDERVTLVARTGWHTVGDRRVFVLPGEAFGAAELVLLNTDAASSPYGYRGALTDWQNGIGRLTAGQRLGVLAVSTALAGPLLYLSGQDGGGIHIRGSSSTGKTSLARAAASVWGPRTYMRSWRATANGLEGAAVLATDTSLVLDELGVIDSRELNAAVYQLAIGHGKGRARRDGSMRTPASWRVMVVSTGEMSIAIRLKRIATAARGPVKRFASSIFRPMLVGDMAPSMRRAMVRTAPQVLPMKSCGLRKSSMALLARRSCRPSSTMASTRPPTSSIRRSRPSAPMWSNSAPMVRSDELRGALL